MRFSEFRHPLVALVGILALLLVAPLLSRGEVTLKKHPSKNPLQEDASTLSGRVVDMEGNPVPNLTLAIQLEQGFKSTCPTGAEPNGGVGSESYQWTYLQKDSV